MKGSKVVRSAQIEKLRLSAVAEKMRPPIEELRGVLAVLKGKGINLSRIAGFLNDEGINYTRGQVKYYIKNHPFSESEILEAKKYV